jgi:hypothetical protein
LALLIDKGNGLVDLMFGHHRLFPGCDRRTTQLDDHCPHPLGKAVVGPGQIAQLILGELRKVSREVSQPAVVSQPLEDLGDGPNGTND